MSRLFLVVPVVALVISLAPAAPVPKEANKQEPVLFPTRVGDRLVHHLDGTELVSVVTAVEKRKDETVVTLGWVVPEKGEVAHDQTVIASARGLEVVRYNGRDFDPSVWWVKLPVQGLNRWDQTWGGQKESVRVVGWERVRVPAGEYRALRVETVTGTGRLTTYWFAPGLGCVRWTADDGRERVLVSYTPGKD
jgi:hypothetical protein